jgi:DNA-binding NtrC family response regulator
MRRKALVVEDDAATRELLRRLVQSQECDVDEAANGEVAVELIDRNDYGVVLLDLVLPRMSGADVLDHVYATNPPLLERIIVVTGLNIEEVRKLFPTVCNALPKPVIPQRLVDSIHKCLHLRTDEFLTSP